MKWKATATRTTLPRQQKYEMHGLKRKLVANPSVSKILRPPLQTFTSRLNEKARNGAESDDFDDAHQSGNEGTDTEGESSGDK